MSKLNIIQNYLHFHTKLQQTCAYYFSLFAYHLNNLETGSQTPAFGKFQTIRYRMEEIGYELMWITYLSTSLENIQRSTKKN